MTTLELWMLRFLLWTLSFWFACALFYFNSKMWDISEKSSNQHLTNIFLLILQSLFRRDYANLYFSLTAFIFVTQLVFSFCYLGAQLTAKAAEVNESIYGTEWYNYPPNIQMYMILIMKRAQKPFIITGYSLVSCSLESFKDVSKFIECFICDL